MFDGMLSQACIYGIQATIYLATQHSTGKYIPVQQIASAVQVPYQFLKKIMRTLTASGITMSQRSTHGGVALAHSPENITVLDVITALDGAELLTTQCILKFPHCGQEQPCPLHEAWSQERERLHQMFVHLTMSTIAEAVHSGHLRLHSHTTAFFQQVHLLEQS
jgi:Rrf2 family protein